MKHPYIILFFLPIWFSCNQSTIDNPSLAKDKGLDTLEYLNKHNTLNIVYKGTAKYNDIHSDANKVEFNLSTQNELIHKALTRGGYDSLAMETNSENLLISHYFSSIGQFLHFEPILKKENEKYILLSPEIIEGSIEIKNNDTIIIASGSNFETVEKLNFIIPLKELDENWTILYKHWELTSANKK